MKQVRHYVGETVGTLVMRHTMLELIISVGINNRAPSDKYEY